MGVEIERKFLVRPELLPALPAGEALAQGYLSTEPVVRVRLIRQGGSAARGKLTIKGPGFLSRAEYEYEIPAADAEELLRLCKRRLQKIRYRIGRWEIDEFTDRALWLAEIELQGEAEPFERPAWLGDEVTTDPRYSNAALAREVSGEGS